MIKGYQYGNFCFVFKLKKLIEAKSIFGSNEFRNCFKDCHESAQKLKNCWSLYNQLKQKEGMCLDFNIYNLSFGIANFVFYISN